MGTLTARFEFAMEPSGAFDLLVAGLRDALARRGGSLGAGLEGGVTERGRTVAKVTAWEPPRRVAFAWESTPWTAAPPVPVEIRLEPSSGGTRIVVEVSSWGTALSDRPEDHLAWFAGAIVAPLLSAISPEGLGEWLTDRRVRRPAGPWARATYADPMFHWPNFLLILDRLGLRAEDRLLEVGCGGGAFLRRALESGCRATAVDHSPEMVRLATEQNREAVASGHLVLLEAGADRLPVADAAFTCAVMTGVIGFLPDPAGALAEIHRALRSGGRLVVFAGTAALRGTPAAPEPFASRIHFFDAEELAAVARAAGFAAIEVEDPDLRPYLDAAKIPEDARELFRPGGGALLLTARRR